MSKHILINKKIEGQNISPILPDGIKNYLIDIDGTICDDIPNEEPDRMSTAKVFVEALEVLNKWYNEGHIITFLHPGLKITEKSLKNGLNIMVSIIMV